MPSGIAHSSGSPSPWTVTDSSVRSVISPVAILYSGSAFFFFSARSTGWPPLNLHDMKTFWPVSKPVRSKPSGTAQRTGSSLPSTLTPTDSSVSTASIPTTENSPPGSLMWTSSSSPSSSPLELSFSALTSVKLPSSSTVTSSAISSPGWNSGTSIPSGTCDEHAALVHDRELDGAVVARAEVDALEDELAGMADLLQVLALALERTALEGRVAVEIVAGLEVARALGSGGLGSADAQREDAVSGREDEAVRVLGHHRRAEVRVPRLAEHPDLAGGVRSVGKGRGLNRNHPPDADVLERCARTNRPDDPVTGGGHEGLARGILGNHDAAEGRCHRRRGKRERDCCDDCDGQQKGSLHCVLSPFDLRAGRRHAPPTGSTDRSHTSAVGRQPHSCSVVASTVQGCGLTEMSLARDHRNRGIASA